MHAANPTECRTLIKNLLVCKFKPIKAGNIKPGFSAD